jgi:RND family efflux transporter MFP subunit
MSSRRRLLRWILPFIVLGIGAAIYAGLIATREKPETEDLIAPSPLVRVITTRAEDLRFSVETRGTVAPRTESDIVAEVQGRVVWMSPNLVVGGLFRAGEELLRLDDREYRIAQDRSRAMITLRESEARLAKAEADRRRELSQRGAASISDLDQFESRALVASASLDEARAVFEQAALDYERTVVRAPYDGRVRERDVDVGRFVSVGTKLARIFAVDYAEVRLPIQTDDLAFLDVGLSGPASGTTGTTPVRLTGRLGGRTYHWPARLERAEAAIDDQTRMLHVVARIDDPYALRSPSDAEPDSETKPNPSRGVGTDEPLVTPRGTSDRISTEIRVPLPAGLFVDAEIEGRAVSGVIVLPTMALRDGNRVFVAEEVPAGIEQEEVAHSAVAGEGASAGEDSSSSSLDRGAAPVGEEALLRIREVTVLRRDRDRVLIGGGLEEGARVVVSPLRIYSEGMRLRLIEATTP